MGPEIWLKNRWSFQRFRWPPMFETDNVNKQTTTTITIRWHELKSHMQNHDFCTICRQHGNCKGMTHLSLVWAVTSIPTDSVSECHGLCSTRSPPKPYISLFVQYQPSLGHVEFMLVQLEITFLFEGNVKRLAVDQIDFFMEVSLLCLPIFLGFKNISPRCTWPNRTRS